jgi:hypothetical protein
VLSLPARFAADLTPWPIALIYPQTDNFPRDIDR